MPLGSDNTGRLPQCLIPKPPVAFKMPTVLVTLPASLWLISHLLTIWPFSPQAFTKSINQDKHLAVAYFQRGMLHYQMEK